MDLINPPHYKDLSPEPIDVIEGWGLGYHLATALKYISRAGRKVGSDEVTDLRKAIWFIERRIRQLETADQVAPATTIELDIPRTAVERAGPWLEVPVMSDRSKGKGPTGI